MHHIFPQNEFSEIADYIENLIALTAAQHMQEAHPNGNTQVVDKEFQYLCLMCKTENIKQNILGGTSDPVIYSFDYYTHVLAVGLNKPNIEDIDENDFGSVYSEIEMSF